MYTESLCYFLLFAMVSAKITVLSDGNSYNFYQWSHRSFPQNFSISHSVSNRSCIVSPPIETTHSDALMFIDQNSPFVMCILIVTQGENLGWVAKSSYLLNSVIPIGILIDEEFTESFNDTIDVVFDNWDSNFFVNTYTTSLVVDIIDLIVILVCLVWVIWKIILLVQVNQFGFRIAPVCIILELFNSLTRLSNASLRINHEIRPDYTDIESIRIALYSFSFIFNLSSGVFVVFFWMNLMSTKIYRGTLLERAFWPSFVVVAIIFVVVFTLSLITIVLNQQSFANYISIFVLPLLLVLAIFYFITAHRVLKYVKNRTGSEGLKKNSDKNRPKRGLFSFNDIMRTLYSSGGRHCPSFGTFYLKLVNEWKKFITN